MQLAGRAGIVTGAGSGIGAATARELAGAGARVLVVDLVEERARAVAAEIDGVAVAADVRRLDDVVAVRERCLEAYGQLDFVVANAGTAVSGSITEGDPEQWRAVFDTNLLGVAYTIRAALPPMLEQRSGDVVIVASASGRIVYTGQPIYLASKWGAVGLGHALRKELGPAGIRVTLIEPGIVDTPLARAEPAGRVELERATPLQPADVGRAIVFALAQPPHVGVRELLVQPVEQEL
jgi:NADP-dependent 3-hydroxy acid dehydrogenase YdfG